MLLATSPKSNHPSRFCLLHSQIPISDLDWTNIFVAGGCVMACLVPELNHDWTHADVDMYVTTRDETDANRILKHIHSVITTNASKVAEERYRKVEVVMTRRTISIHTVWKVFQVVTTLFSAPLEILIGFDVDSGCVGTSDGITAVSTKRGALAMRKRYNFWMLSLRPNLAFEGRYQKRLLKYSNKGFGVLASGIDWTKVPLLDGKRADELKGIALLALYDRKALAHSNSTPRSEQHVFATGIEECIHGGDSWCHYCHKKLPHEEADAKSRISVAEPLKWERINVSRQDFDDGVQIRSFAHLPDVPLSFDEHVYSHLNKKTEAKSQTGDEKNANEEQGSDEPAPAPILLSHQPGIETPVCYCGTPCKMRMSKKEGPNHRRRFFCCVGSQTEHSCKFFMWEGASLPYDQERALRLRTTAHIDHLTQGFAEPSLMDTSKQLLAIASCFKSGRLSDRHRKLLKDLVLTNSTQSKEEPTVSPIFSDYAEHFDIDELSRQLTEYCKIIELQAVPSK